MTPTEIYVPYDGYGCYVIQGEGTIRAYHTVPYYNRTVSYTDFFINSHYLEREGVQTFGSSGTLPTCINSSRLTTDFYYRHDIADIMLTFTLVLAIAFYMPLKIFSKLFKKGGL